MYSCWGIIGIYDEGLKCTAVNAMYIVYSVRHEMQYYFNKLFGILVNLKCLLCTVWMKK